jgi:D-serine deaminase-like pyridoxal phosphate-dependent protein
VSVRLGIAAAAIDTPALVVDLDAMDRNIATLAAYARQHHLRLRPHAKTHKSAWIAAQQIAAGALGVCVQKTGEAEALVEGGIHDVFITNEVIDPAKLARVAALARRCRLSIAVDSALGIEGLAAAVRGRRSEVHVFVEIDVGQGRCGTTPQRAGLLARQVVDAGLHWAGLQAYHGRAQHLRGSAERAAAIAQAAACVRQAQAAIADAGLSCPLVSGGGTGSFVNEAASGLWGELQAGSYVFMDRDYADNAPAEGAPRFEHALFVKAQVISRAEDRAVIDAGHKSHAIDSGLPRAGAATISNTSTVATNTASCVRTAQGLRCRRSALACGSCPAIATRRSTCTTRCTACAAGSSTVSSNARSSSALAAASVDAPAQQPMLCASQLPFRVRHDDQTHDQGRSSAILRRLQARRPCGGGDAR